MATGLSSKRLQLLKETAPRRLSGRSYCHISQTRSRRSKSKKWNARPPDWASACKSNASRSPDDFPAAFSAAAQDGAEGLLTTIETFFIIHRARVIELAADASAARDVSVRDFVGLPGAS